MEVFWFWLLVILLFTAVFAWPTWPYTRDRGLYRHERWRYAPSGAAAGAAILIVLLFWLGLLVIVLPWAAAPPVVVQ